MGSKTRAGFGTEEKGFRWGIFILLMVLYALFLNPRCWPKEQESGVRSQESAKSEVRNQKSEIAGHQSKAVSLQPLPFNLSSPFALLAYRANPYVPPTLKIYGLEEPQGPRHGGTGPALQAPPQSATPHNADQVLLSVYDAVNGALKANATLGGGSTNPTPRNADQVFLAVYDSVNGAIRVNLVAGGGPTSYSQIVALWASGSCSGYLKSDGTCNSSPGGGPGTGTQYASSYWATTSALGSVAPPTTKGKYFLGYNLTSDAAAAPVSTQVGFAVRGVSGTTDTILYSDVSGGVNYTSSSAVAVALPTATTLENSSFAVNLWNINSSGVTVTPAGSWTINGAATVVIGPQQSCFVQVDPAGSAWDAVCHDAPGYWNGAAGLPAPTSSSRGGVESLGQTSHQWINSISTSGVPASSQPGVADLSDTPSQGQVHAGPSAYGAAAATATFRALVPQDIPSGLLSCAILDNAICTSSVDTSGNPNFLAADSTAPKIDVNGGTTPLTYFVGGVYQQINSQLVVTPTTPASDTAYFVIVKQDTAHANPVSADLVVTNIVPAYQYTAPTCSSAATATNPHFWYNLAANAAEWCISNGGSFSAQSSLVLGVAVVSSSPTVVAVLAEPYRLNPYKRFETFGTGADGVLTVTGSTSVNGLKSYSFILVDGASANLHHTSHDIFSGDRFFGLWLRSQNPVIITNSGTVGLSGIGQNVGTPGTGAGTAGGNAGGELTGSGGGGGGSSTNGGGGGGQVNVLDFFGHTAVGYMVSGGTAGASSGGNGGGGGNAATETLVGPILPGPWFLGVGPSGGNGGGDGTNAGGQGGAGGGAGIIIAPSILVSSGATVTASGAAGSAATAGNAGGGGGGSGGNVILAGGFVCQNGTFVASGGAYGAGYGTGGHGGAGGNGTAATVKLW